jgi:signal transduction histidine kinase
VNRARLIYTILSIYIVSAFSWWTFAHYRSAKKIHELQINKVELECYKASIDLEQAKQQELFEDSIGLKRYFYANNPQLEVIFMPNGEPISNYMIRPKLETYLRLESEYRRKFWMYILEGSVMMALIFWGMYRIYLSFQQDLNLKRNQRNFLLSVTHELKTPLTSIKLYLETIQKRKLDSDQIQTIVRNSLEDSERLNLLVENLLLSARIESTHFNLDIREINLSDLLEETVRHFSAPRNISERISMKIEEQVYVMADPSSMDIIITNLLSNALKYTPANSQIFVSLETNKTYTSLKVEDEGPGIADKDKKELFNRFFRTGDENTRKTKGTGLGLYIVKNLAHLQKAEVFVENREPNGCIFEIRLKNHGG